MAWLFDIENAPRGHTILRKGKPVHVPESVFLATKCGKVGRSQWVPPTERDHHDVKKEGRWEGLHYGEQPVAWQPWPRHPREEASC